MAWMSEDQAATALGVSFRAIRRRVGNGSLRVKRQGSQILVDVDVSRGPERPKPAAGMQAGLAIEGDAHPTPDNTARRATATNGRDASAAASAEVPAIDLPLAERATPVNPWAVRMAGSNMRAFEPPPTAAAGSRLAVVLVWILLTLMLFGGAVAGFFHHRAAQEYAQLETRYNQATTSLHEAQVQYERELKARDEAADERQREHAAELETLRSRIEQSATELARERQEKEGLAADLEILGTRLADALADRQALTDKLAAAQSAAPPTTADRSIADVFRRAGGQLANALTARANTPTPARHVDTATTPPADATATLPDIAAPPTPARSGDRPIPRQPARLDGSAPVPTLRPIMQSPQN